jgi:hypothetical protein
LEADWEFEIGADAPVIDALWQGFVDLRVAAKRVRELPETAQLPGLVAALARLNSECSPVWTSKCDFWPLLEPEEFDADELDALAGCSTHAASCYIDLLPKIGCAWSLPGDAEAACKHLCGLFGPIPLRCCRVDLIIRRALIAADETGLGITAYITACGTSPDEAAQMLETALAAFTHVLNPDSTVQ